MNAIQQMQAMAEKENRRMRRRTDRAASTRQADWMALGIHKSTIAAIFSALRGGLGIDDMQANGTATREEAEKVIAWMRKRDKLQEMYWRK